MEKAQSTSFLLFWDPRPCVPLDLIALSDMQLFTLFTQPKYQCITKSLILALHQHCIFIKLRLVFSLPFSVKHFESLEMYLYFTLFINPSAYCELASQIAKYNHLF